MTVNTPPASGPNAGNYAVTEGILELRQQPMLTRVFRGDAYTIRARSVGIAGSGSTGCVLALNTTASPAITVNGNSAVSMSACSVYSNSNAANSINTSGGGSLVANDFFSVGGIDASTTIVGAKHPYDKPIADPYAGLPITTINCPATRLPSVITGPATILPGAYCNGLKLKSGNITLAAGAYIVVGGAFEVMNNATVDATAGVTIITAMYNNCLYSSSMSGGASLNLVAPRTGTYAGVAFYADRNIPTYVNIDNGFIGQANMLITGAIYAPTSAVTCAGGDNAIGCTQIIAQTVKVTGGSQIGSNCGGSGTKTIGSIALTALTD